MCSPLEGSVYSRTVSLRCLLGNGRRVPEARVETGGEGPSDSVNCANAVYLVVPVVKRVIVIGRELSTVLCRKRSYIGCL